VTTDLEARQINTIRGLALDAVKQANSGHTGTAMALAPLAHVLWTRIMTYDATDTQWPDRDRFILSAGHASMLLYSMLYLSGQALSLDDIKDFRQWGSLTPGHPEVGHTAGVEVTTGPLGQGVANAVGMALAERNLRARYGSATTDHHTFVVCGDGDLMEGLSHEAASLAGHQGLGRLTAIYDDNNVTIDGLTDLSLSDDAAARFRAYGWHVVELGEVSEDCDAIEAGIRSAMAVEDRPSMVILKSTIAYPAPNAMGTPAAHGAITDDEEIAAAKVAMGLPVDQPFHVADDVLEAYRAAGARGAEAREAWQKRVADTGGDQDFQAALMGATGLPGWASALPSFEVGGSVATRKANSQVLNAIGDVVPSIISGSADLTGNTGTDLKAAPISAAEPGGRLMYYGVREHAMGSIANGMALHGGVLPVVGTFLVFSDYMRPAVRMAALSGAKVAFVWSHDSVGVGEDGPTHQPVEHVAALRTIPGLPVFRPADANEVAQAWQVVVDGDGPAALILTRQNVPTLAGTQIAGQVARGGYALSAPENPAVVLAATGSEVHLCVDAAAALAADGIVAQVVSLPCWELFDQQEAAYRDQVLPEGVPVVGVEAGVSLGWDQYADATITIDRFGASAPGDEVMERLGFTADNVANIARTLIG
jgi:transketolase